MKKWLFRYMKKHWILMAISAALVIAAAAIDVTPPYIMKTAIDSYITNPSLSIQERSSGITRTSLLFLGVVGASFLLNFLTLYTSSYAGARIIYDLRKDLFNHVMHLPMSFFDKTHSGVITTRITNDTQNLMEFFVTVFTSLIKDVFLIAGILFALIKLSLELLGVLSPVMVAVVVVTVIFRKFAREIYRIVRSNIARINAFLAEHIAGMEVVQAFEVREVKREEFRTITEQYYRNALKQLAIFGVFRPSMDLIYSFGLALIVWFGSGMVQRGIVGIGTLFAFASYLDMFFNPIRDFAEKFDIAQSSLASAEKIESILKERREELGKGLRKPVEKGVVEFKDVWLAYEDENWVLKGVNARFEPGGVNAIVGETGAGKTSMMSLLNLTYRPQKGQILIDGIDVKEYDLRFLRRQIAVVPQEVVLFAGTILDNVRLFDDSIPEEKVMEALDKVHALDVFSKFPEGVKTKLTERGSNLSLGERQLIALARAVLMDAKILVLDEATASIDSATEALIQRAIEELSRDRNVIVIAHRLSTVKNAKKIFVVHSGRVVEEGTHEQLMSKRGYYYRLYSKMREGRRSEETKALVEKDWKDSLREAFRNPAEEF